MAVVEMSGLTVVGPRSEVVRIARRLLVKGCFQPVPVDMVVADRDIRSRLKTKGENPWDELLEEMRCVWKSAGREIPEIRVYERSELPSYEEASSRVERISRRLQIWAGRGKVLASEEEELEAARIYVEALQKSGISGSDAFNTEILKIFAGNLSEDNYERLQEASAEVPLIVFPLKKSGNTMWIIVITVSGYLEGAEKLLDSVYFRNSPIEEVLKDADSDWKSYLDTRIEKHKRAISKLKEAAANYLDKNNRDLEELYSRVYCMKHVYDICRRRGQVGDLFVVSGWLPLSEIESVRKIVDEEAPETIIISESTEKTRTDLGRIPVLLKNLPFVKDFQDVVALYSMPLYNESDPSVFVAFTFCLFFGFMFGDVGHGLMIIAGAMFFEHKRLLSRSFASVLRFAGLSSVLFGFLYGSIFGNENLINGIWLSPLEDMQTLIQSSLVLGIAVISAGMLINISVRYRKKEFGKLFFDSSGVAGLVLYWLSVALAWSALAERALPVPSSLLIVFVLLLLGVIFFSDVLAIRLLKEKIEMESPVVHVFHVLHSLLSFLSNTVSFVRLAAFALNHVGLSLAVLMLSRMVTDLPGGSVITWIILIVGHLVIVTLEGLIVFIQTLRLEYYEFFSKFYTGGGNRFDPVTWEGGKKNR